MAVNRKCLAIVVGAMASVVLATSAQAETESDFYRLVTIATSAAATESRDPNWRPAKGSVVLEVSGLERWDDQQIAVAIRKGEVWILNNVYQEDPAKIEYHRFASALHEPLGLLKDGDALLTTQRTELTALRDRDGDNIADEYETLAQDWGVTGHYHEYAYGPKRDGNGDLWLTLNIGMGLKADHLQRTLTSGALGYRQAAWRGWAMKLNPKTGELIPVCAGMRSPSGLGANARGDMFYTDQQGNWVATNSLHHLRPAAFFHHPEALASMDLPGSPITGIKTVPAGMPMSEAVRRLPQLKAPAVWLPYKKMGQSATDIVLDEGQGRFGPFGGQLFVGEFTQAAINRVDLELVDGEYQGACFPFRSGMASAVLRLLQGTDGSLFIGMTNRGWSSLGSASYGLQRLVWTGRMPFEIHSMRARHDGFMLRFTRPVDPTSASDPRSYSMESYTYRYHQSYGSDEIQRKSLSIRAPELSEDRLEVRLHIDGLRALFVHELRAHGIRDLEGRPLLHDSAYYTLNRIPQP